MKTVDVGYLGDVAKTRSAFPEWYLSNRIKQLEAENANLRDINKSLGEEHSKLAEENEALVERNTRFKTRLNKFYGMTSVGEELRAENEKLKAEVADLKERIDHLEIIQRLLVKENNKLRGTKNELDTTVAKLKQELARFTDEHTVEFLYEKHEDGKHFIGWTEVSGEEYELTFVTPERTIYE